MQLVGGGGIALGLEEGYNGTCVHERVGFFTAHWNIYPRWPFDTPTCPATQNGTRGVTLLLLPCARYRIREELSSSQADPSQVIKSAIISSCLVSFHFLSLHSSAANSLRKAHVGHHQHSHHQQHHGHHGPHNHQGPCNRKLFA